MARYLNVSTKLVQAWEADQRTPSGPALVLLRIMEKQPGLIDTFYAHQRYGQPRPARSSTSGIDLHGLAGSADGRTDSHYPRVSIGRACRKKQG